MLLFIIIFASCSDDDSEANPQDALLKTWTLSSGDYIKKDDADVTADFDGFSISFNANGIYTTEAAGDLFPATGTWKWADTGTTNLLLDGDWPVAVSALSATHVTLALTKDDGITSGRPASMAGEYVLSLTARN
jgi:hypothetical protein